MIASLFIIRMNDSFEGNLLYLLMGFNNDPAEAISNQTAQSKSDSSNFYRKVFIPDD